MLLSVELCAPVFFLISVLGTCVTCARQLGEYPKSDEQQKRDKNRVSFRLAVVFMTVRRANLMPPVEVAMSRILVLQGELGGPAGVLIAFRGIGHSQSPLNHEAKEKR